MLEAVLTLTGLAFWTVTIGTVLLSIVVMALVEFNRPFWATALVIATIAGTVTLTHYPIWDEIRANPMMVLYWFIGYIILGGLWSFFKWTRFVTRTVKEWVKRGYSEDLRRLNAIKDAESDDMVELPREIDPTYNKDRFFGWSMYWPLSVIWTLFDDPFRAIFDFLYEQFGQLYTKIAKRIARRIAAAAKV
jgi:hypothetical protein